jgi:hypothetical protein
MRLKLSRIKGLLLLAEGKNGYLSKFNLVGYSFFIKNKIFY